MEQRIHDIVQTALTELGAGEVSFAVEWPSEMAHGDYAVNAALAASKSLGKSPREVADMLVPKIVAELGNDASSVDVAGPGFINIKLSPEAIMQRMLDAQDDEWGKGTAYEGKRIIVEYSCPNPFKEMHIGHLMSTVIGEAISRVIENSGARVIRDSYGGDVGPHVAKALWALRRKNVADIASATEVDRAYAEGSRAYEANKDAKTEIEVLNEKLYEGEDAELMRLWSRGREACLESFRELYKVLGTSFDYYFFESETAAIGMDVVKEGLAKGIFKESDGAVIYEGEKKGLHTLVFITSRGTPTYEAKDIGLAFLKEERIPSDRSIIITAAEQIGHFKVFLAALEELAPLVAAKTSHIPHGFLRLTTGKMSSREGNTVTARAFISDVIEQAKRKNEDPLIAEAVAVAAIKYMILRQAPGGDIVFDAEKSLSLEGDSGPYLQYAYVRAKKILSYESENAGEKVPDAPYLIERLIIRYPEIAARAAREHAPHHIAQYLTKLASEWNSFYASEQVLGSPEEAYKQRLAKAFANTMQKGLGLLGIPVPERM